MAREPKILDSDLNFEKYPNSSTFTKRLGYESPKIIADFKEELNDSLLYLMKEEEVKRSDVIEFLVENFTKAELAIGLEGLLDSNNDMRKIGNRVFKLLKELAKDANIDLDILGIKNLSEPFEATPYKNDSNSSATDDISSAIQKQFLDDDSEEDEQQSGESGESDDNSN